MFAKILVLAVLAVCQVYAQTAAQINCGQVAVPPQSPVQAWNFLTWLYPGQIAWNNCNTGYVQGTYDALTQLYNQLYSATPPPPRAPIPAN